MSSPPPPEPLAQLGCAQSYSAAVHWRGGGQVYISANLVAEALTEVTWDRRVMETATARIVIAKSGLPESCCGLLGQIHPWCHELTVYRDTDLVWQGPITTVTETQTTVAVDALDITAWLGRLVNTHSLNHKTKIDVTAIATEVIRENLNDAALSTPEKDWPKLLPYLTVTPAGEGIKLARKSIWTDTVLNIINDIAEKGFEWTTVGRRMVIRPPATGNTRPAARLTTDDLPGGVQVSRDGLDAATRVFATSQTESDDGITVTTSIKGSRAVCGRIDQIVRDDPRVDVETDAEEKARHKAIRDRRDRRIRDERNDASRDIDAILEGADTPAERKAAEARRKLRDERIDQFREDYEDEIEASDEAIAQEQREAETEVLQTLARQALKGRWPVPLGITVTDGAQLAPTAPVTVRKLVPGARVDIVTADYCMALTQAMRLNRVSGTWGDSGEAITVSLVPLRELAEVDA